MAHLQYMPGDPRLVDQLVYELKSKGIFDQFRKDCIADVDTRPAYQNLRQRVENSVSSFLARQVWKPDLNKNQLREKLRKHVLEGNYLEQGVERIVDQVVNPKLATVFVPKVEDLVYDYLGITRKKNSVEASNGIVDLLPTDLEAVSPGSVKSNEDKDEAMEVDVINEPVDEQKNAEMLTQVTEKIEEAETSGVSELTIPDSDVSDDKDSIPLPAEEIRPEDIPPPENSPPKIEKVEVDKIELPKEQDVATDIPLPDEIPKPENGTFFKNVNSDDDSSSDSSLRRNMSPLTPIRSYNNENSCDAQQAFENQLIESKKEVMKEPSTFRFALDSKSNENSLEAPNMQKNESDLSYQLNQVNINNFITPAYEESSNSNNLHIDYESDANSKVNTETKYEADQTFEDTKKEKKPEEKKNRHKSSHRSRDSSKHSTNREKKSDSKPSSSRDSSRHGKKSSKDDKHKTNEKAKSKDRSEKKENKDSSRHRSSHQSSHKDSKSHRSSSSSHKHSSKSDDKKSTSSNQKDKDKNSYKSSSKDKYSKDSKSSSHHSDRERKSSSSNKSRSNDKDKKSKKDIDDHYSLSGRGNLSRRSTDRDSNDGSSSSKGSHQPSSSKSSESKKDSKESTSKSENSSGSGSTTPSEKEAPHDVDTKADVLHNKPIIRIETHLETPVASPPRLPFVPDITLKKPKIAANFDEAKKIMKMRKFLEEEQRRMNQEAALLLEFQANVRPSLSQVYSSIPGPELEFACNTKTATQYVLQNSIPSESKDTYEEKTYTNAELYQELNAGNETEMNSDNDNVELDDNKTIISLHVEGCEISNESEKANTTLSGDLKMSEIKGELIINKDHINLSEMRAHAKKNKVKKNKSREICKTENKKDKHKHYLENDKTGINIEKNSLQFFAQHEKYNSELEKTKYNDFLKRFIEKTNISDKLYLINCDTYEENVLKDVASTFGEYEIVSYHRNGQLKMPKTKAIVKNLNLAAEVSLPIDSQSNDSDIKCQVFSPGKSDCSFELSNDYDAKLEEMVNKTSRKEIMQIILGDVIDGSPSKMPKIDYITELNIDSAIDCNLKRKIIDTETTENNNRPILTPHKIRKMSTSELITSTTQDTEESKTNDNLANVRSKYLGRAKRVGLPRPKRTELPNSPSSDKSVENYEQNTPTKNSNGKVKAPRHLVQRYDTSDLYKPKLHFLSRRNVS